MSAEYQVTPKDRGDNMPMDRAAMFTIVDRPPEWETICLLFGYTKYGVAWDICAQRRGVIDNEYAARVDKYLVASLIYREFRLTWQSPFEDLSALGRYKLVAMRLRGFMELTPDEVCEYIALAEEAGVCEN